MNEINRRWCVCRIGYANNSNNSQILLEHYSNWLISTIIIILVHSNAKRLPMKRSWMIHGSSNVSNSFTDLRKLQTIPHFDKKKLWSHQNIEHECTWKIAYISSKWNLFEFIEKIMATLWRLTDMCNCRWKWALLFFNQLPKLLTWLMLNNLQLVKSMTILAY